MHTRDLGNGEMEIYYTEEDVGPLEIYPGTRTFWLSTPQECVMNPPVEITPIEVNCPNPPGFTREVRSLPTVFNNNPQIGDELDTGC